ncbi:MAG: leukotoxin LktA family filamentous adhesin [Phascolarctobacterium sp.]
MLGTQKSLKNIKKYLEGKAGSSMLSMKVLRYVLAVGFVLAPWLGGEAYADTPGIVLANGTKLSYQTNGTVDIYAQQVNGNLGWNSFTHFNVDAGKTANLHFWKKDTDATVDTLVNTVTNQININGLVKALKKDGTVGGNLYFFSPGGMVVGSTGVINAGSLTVMALDQDSFSALNINIFNPNSTFTMSDSGNITVNGEIRASGKVDLRAAYVSITRPASDNSSTTNTNNTNSSTTVTGANLINEVVNLTGNEGSEATVLKAVINASGNIEIKAVNEMEFINAQIESSNGHIELDAIGDGAGILDMQGSSVTAAGHLKIEVGNTIDIDSYSSITSQNDAINMHTEKGNIKNDGTIRAKNNLNVTAGNSNSAKFANIENTGIIEQTNTDTSQSTVGTISITAHDSVTNTGLIKASSQIKFTVSDTLTNRGTIQSTGSNVQAHIGRDFNNFGARNDPSDTSKFTGGIITAGGNVQVDYPLDRPANHAGTFGISNSGLIWAKGDVDPTYDAEGNIVSSGSGNIWLTSNYNIENTATGQMIANRQITLNARDFLHNYGLIQGVTYLDIKSIMGYVYNHASGKIIATGGNIALSSGQENLQITGDTDGTRKELYRKFTPIIIEGSVEATSDDDINNQTKEGNIKITAHLGDIYINGGTIKTKPKTNPSDDIVAKAGDVILKAAQNITIGFETVSDSFDDPTTTATDDARKYYIPKVENGNLVSGNASTISGTNVTLIAGSINNKHALIGGNLTLDPKTKVKLEGSLTLQGNNMTVSGVQRSDNSSGSLQVVANGVGGTDSAINSLNLNINDNLLFDKLNVNTADITVSGDLQINKLHVADLAHFTSNNTVVGVYGGSTTPSNDQSDALFRDLGNGSTTWMGLTISNGSYSVTNSTQISNSVENLAQMSAKMVDYTPQDSYNEHYGDISGCFERYDIIEAPNRPTGGIAPTAESGGAELKQDENGLHIEMKNNNFEHEMDQRREQDKGEGEKEA